MMFGSVEGSMISGFKSHTMSFTTRTASGAGS